MPKTLQTPRGRRVCSTTSNTLHPCGCGWWAWLVGVVCPGGWRRWRKSHLTSTRGWPSCRRNPALREKVWRRLKLDAECVSGVFLSAEVMQKLASWTVQCLSLELARQSPMAVSSLSLSPLSSFSLSFSPLPSPSSLSLLSPSVPLLCLSVALFLIR